MSNDYFTTSGTLTDHTLARASDVLALLQGVEGGFDKLPGELPLKQSRVTYAADSGSANAYVVTLANAPASYVAGLHVAVKIGAANTGASTLNVNGLGVVSIKRVDGTALVAGDLPAGAIIEMRYTGTEFRICSAAPASTMSTFPDGSVSVPGMRFESDPDCGRRRVSANVMADVVAGADVVTYGASSVAVSGNLSTTGLLLAGVSSGSTHEIKTSGGQEVELLRLSNTNGLTAGFLGGNTTSWNAALTCLYLAAHSVTGRSLNSPGTLNAAGADVAETKWKSTGCGIIARGQVCGLDADGMITDRWSAMKLPRWKTGLLVEPALVMGDTWGSPNTACVLDGLPLGTRPQAPSVPEGGEDDAGYLADLAEYEAELAEWQPRFDANRAEIDRLVYCGTNGIRLADKVGARPPEAGDYIVLVEAAGDAIGWSAVAPADITLAQLHLSIGRVERIADGGVPLVAARL